MLEIEALISSSLPWWEKVADFCGIAAGLAAVCAILVDVVPFISAERARRFKWGLAFVLIAGVFGQIAATHMVSNITYQITAFLNDKAQAANKLAGEANKLAGEANERAGKANERAAALEVTAQELKKENLEQRKQLAKYGILTGDRTINDVEREQLANDLRGERYSITIVKIDNREAGKYADAIVDALRKAHVKVRIERMPTTPELGVIVCDKGKRESNLVKIFNRAAILTTLSGKATNRPEVCDHEMTPPLASAEPFKWMSDALFGNGADDARGTVVLVGQKKPLIP
jgi:hypothetical protein